MLKSHFLKGFSLVISATLLQVLLVSAGYANDTFYGKFHQLYSDQTNGQHHLLHTLEFDNGTKLPLTFRSSAPDNIQSGTRVLVFGELVNQDSSPQIVVDEIYPIFHDTLSSQSETFSSTTVVKKAVVFRVNFSDANVECSANQIADHMWSGTKNVNTYFQQNSFGYVSFPSDTNNDSQPDIYDVTIAASKNEACTFNAVDNWATLADTAAVSQGFNPSLYQYRIYVLPIAVSCGWAGLGYVGCGNNCQSWSKRCDLVDVIPHEIGHNLKFMHASVDTNANLIYNSGGTDCEYCDTSGIMGYGGIGWRHFHASHKASMGWIPSDNISAVASSGNFTILASEVSPDGITPAPSTGTQVLRLNLQIPNGSSTENAMFDISFRSQFGDYSSSLPAAYRSKVSIHRVIDYTLYPRTLQIASLTAGQSHQLTSDVAVLFNSFNQLEASVSIAISASATPTATGTITATVTPENTNTPEFTATPTATPSPTFTNTPAVSPTKKPVNPPIIVTVTPVATATKFVPPYEVPKTKPAKAPKNYVAVKGVVRISSAKLKNNRLIVSAISESGSVVSVRADRRNNFQLNLMPGKYQLQIDLINSAGASVYSNVRNIRVKSAKSRQKMKSLK